MNVESIEQRNVTATSRDMVGSGGLDGLLSNWKAIAAVVVVVAVGAVGYYWYSAGQREENAVASAALARVRPLVAQGQLEQALVGTGVVAPVGTPPLGLKAIATQYGSTEAGKVAALLAGNALSTLGRYTEAESFYASAQSSDADVTQIGGLAGQAACKEAAKDYAAAGELYERAAGLGAETGLDHMNLVCGGLAYEKAGNKEKAGALFRQAVDKYPNADLSDVAKAGLVRLGMPID